MTRPKSFIFGVAVGLALGFLLAILNNALIGRLPRLGLALEVDDAFTKVHVGDPFDTVARLLGPEQGQLNDDLILRNLKNRWGSFDAKDFGIPSELGGKNSIWLNNVDTSVFLVVSFGKDGKVRSSYELEMRFFSDY